jgi:hypothetical protein
LNGNKVGREQTCKIRLPSDVGREETCKIILPSEVGREKIRLNGVDIDREETCKISEYKLQVSQHYAGNWQQFFIDKKDKMPKSKNYATV